MEGSMEEVRCPVCGCVMRVDNFTHEPFCPSCGNKDTKDADHPFVLEFDKSLLGNEPEAPADVVMKASSLVSEGNYAEALEILNGLKKDNRSSSAVILLTMLCGYHVKSMKELLLDVSASPMSIQILVTRPDWNKLAEYLFLKENQFVIHVLEYCALCLRLSGTDMNKMFEKLKSMRGKGKMHSSTLAGIDKEDEHNNERAKALKDAKNPPEYNMWDDVEDIKYDYMHTDPVPSRFTYASDNTDINMALDLFELFTGNIDRPAVYEPFKHTRKYNYELMHMPAPKNGVYRKDSKKKKEIVSITVNDCGYYDKQEMRVRQEMLLDMISDEEKLILP